MNNQINFGTSIKWLSTTVKLSDSQMNKLKSTTKYVAKCDSRIIMKCDWWWEG